jgi:hypothetical protein
MKLCIFLALMIINTVAVYTVVVGTSTPEGGMVRAPFTTLSEAVYATGTGQAGLGRHKGEVRSVGGASDSSFVVTYLVKNGHLSSHSFTNSELKRALRQFQRENGLRINGRISAETIKAVQTDLDLITVVDYLKTYNYIQGHVTPQKTKLGVEQLQQNLGWVVTGNVDGDLVDFVKNNKERSYAEPIFVPSPPPIDGLIASGIAQKGLVHSP